MSYCFYIILVIINRFGDANYPAHDGSGTCLQRMDFLGMAGLRGQRLLALNSSPHLLLHPRESSGWYQA
jgi:hypothetical protein